MIGRSANDRKAEAAVYRTRTEEARRLNTSNKQIPTIELNLCKYDKTRKVLKLSSEYMGMPLTFFVKSNHTGKEVRFVPVTPADVLFDQDQWDGEQQIYRPLGDVPGVDHLVIFNQY